MDCYITVTKASLFDMIVACKDEIYKQAVECETKVIQRYIINEKNRCENRVWYRFWILPKPRFDYKDPDSIREFSSNIDYDLFESDPFFNIKIDKSNSINFISKLFDVSISEMAGDYIKLEIDLFLRISNPTKYKWVTDNIWLSVKD